MATPLPAALKSADVQRFVTRAQQLSKFRPIITYWCEYYILNQILGRNLHTTDPECQTYAIQLMDKLEQTKAENIANDAITDDVAAKAYVENFALDTFNRADEAQRTNKVTRQTADTFQAAATFLDLAAIWGEVDPEIKAKSKFAKFHALRIAKALKAGEDPNATNPVIEEPPAPEPLEDGIEAELKDLENDAGVASSAYQPPTVESAVDVEGAVLPPDPEPADIDTVARAEPTAKDYDVSPIDGTENANARQGSIGDGYFPSVPNEVGGHDGNTIPDIPVTFAAPSAPSAPAPTSPDAFYQDPQLPSAPSLETFSAPKTPDRPDHPPPERANPQPPAPIIPSPAAPFAPPPVAPISAVPPVRTSQGPPPGGYNTDDESVMNAQKHAKWAISALNFEDVNTAVSELRIALRSLGAS